MNKYDLVSNLQTAFKLYDRTLEQLNIEDFYQYNQLLNIATEETSLPIMTILRIIDVTNNETSMDYFIDKYTEKEIMKMIDHLHKAVDEKIYSKEV